MGKRGISYEELILDMPVELYHLKELKIDQSINEHATAYITGSLKEGSQDAIHKLTSQTNIKIKAKTESGEKTIFSGIPINVTLKHLHEGYDFDIILKSGSIRLDIQKKCRSFQNQNNPYSSLFKTILQDYGGDVFDAASQGAVQNGTLIQYEETDWEFLKRAASRIGAGIFPDVLSDRPRIYIGIPEGNNYNEQGTDYYVEKNLKEYLCFQNNPKDRTEQDFVSYWLEGMEDNQLGDKITYQGISFTAAGKISEIKNGILTYQYRLQSKSGLKQNILYNQKLKGISIEGKVLAVEKDRVKVHLSIDLNQSLSEAAWIPFESLYTTEGSTGWYCMPEVGESVQLYIPAADEKELYVRTVNRLDGTTNSKVQDPDVKYYGTSHGKEIRMSQKELTFSAAGNKLYLKMDNNTGIKISSHQDIHIKTQNQLLTECQTMEIESNDKILIATHASSIIVDDIVHIKG